MQGITLLGGDPFEEENQEALVPFMRRVKERYPNKDVWAYTGYLYEELLENGRKHTEYTDAVSYTHLDVYKRQLHIQVQIYMFFLRPAQELPLGDESRQEPSRLQQSS